MVLTILRTTGVVTLNRGGYSWRNLSVVLPKIGCTTDENPEGPRIHYSRGCVIKFQSMIRVRCLWLRPDIPAEEWPEKEAQRVQRFWKCVRLFLRNQAPAGVTAQSLSVEERLQLLKHCKHRSQTGPKLHPSYN